MIAPRFAAIALTLIAAFTACGTPEGVGVPVSTQTATSNGQGLTEGQDPNTVAFLEPCPESGAPVGRGDGLPELELPCLGPGEPVQLAGLTGRPQLINVWASWCGPCRDELPWLQEASQSGKVAVLGVDAEDRSGAAGDLLADLDVTFPSVFDPSNEFARAIGIPTKPTTVFVSRDGEIVHVQPGAFTSYEDLAEQVELYLGVQL